MKHVLVLYLDSVYFSICISCFWWRGGATGRALEFFGLAINRSWVQILLGAKLRNNIGQVVHTYVSLSPSSITWYRPRGDDAGLAESNGSLPPGR